EAARAGIDIVDHDDELIATGAATVFVNRAPLGRISEETQCGGKLIRTSARTFIGGESGSVIPENERKHEAGNAPVILQGLLFGGLTLMTGGMAAGYMAAGWGGWAAWGAASVRVLAPVGGGMVTTEVAERSARALGASEFQARLWGVGAGFAGGGLAGRGGSFAAARIGGRFAHPYASPYGTLPSVRDGADMRAWSDAHRSRITSLSEDARARLVEKNEGKWSRVDKDALSEIAAAHDKAKVTQDSGALAEHGFSRPIADEMVSVWGRKPNAAELDAIIKPMNKLDDHYTDVAVREALGKRGLPMEDAPLYKEIVKAADEADRTVLGAEEFGRSMAMPSKFAKENAKRTGREPTPEQREVTEVSDALVRNHEKIVKPEHLYPAYREAMLRAEATAQRSAPHDPGAGGTKGSSGTAGPSKVGVSMTSYTRAPSSALTAIERQTSSRPISGELKTFVDSMKTGEVTEIPPGTDKSGLVAYLNGKEVEFGLYRDLGTNRLYITRGTDSVATVPKLPGARLRLIYHNHPSGNWHMSQEAFGDLGFMHDRNPLQKSTMIGTRDGTFRQRVPSVDEAWQRNRLGDLERVQFDPDSLLMRSTAYSRTQKAPLNEIAPRRPFADLRKMGDDYRAQELEANLRAGKVITVAGGPGQKPLRVAGDLAAKYGGEAGDWVKVTTHARTLSNGRVISMHAYKNTKTLQVVEEKFIIDEWTAIP
ncbi:MAG: hypothetical protein HOV80_10445, partial [Polyangiaceae bacterium]|nr:hypothetical protein [Polyangiaceae bacterium]